MIIPLTRYTPRLALRIKDTVVLGQLTDWQRLQLIIQSPTPKPGCHTGGSPWYLCGCWPFHPTGIDLANPQLPDFPAIAIDAFDTDDEGRVIFNMDDRVWNLPNGRYTGTIRVRQQTPPINIPAVRKHIPFGQLGSDSRYTQDRYIVPCEPPAPVLLNPEPACELFTFDIDLVPECAQHMVDMVAATMARATCGDDIEFCGSCNATNDGPSPWKETNCGFEEDLCGPNCKPKH